MNKIIDMYIQRARNIIRNYSKQKREDIINTGLARLDMLFARSMNIQDYKGALAAQKEIHDLTGVRAPREQKIIGDKDNPLILETKEEIDLSKLTDKELDQLQRIKNSLASG